MGEGVLFLGYKLGLRLSGRISPMVQALFDFSVLTKADTRPREMHHKESVVATARLIDSNSPEMLAVSSSRS